MKKCIAYGIISAMMLALVACGQPNTSSSSQNATSSAVVSSSSESIQTEPNQSQPIFRIAGMKGPTGMGIVKLMQDVQQKQTEKEYEIELYGTAQEILPKMVQGELDIALIPANVASNLYHQTDGNIQVAAINTLGVLYAVENGESIQSIQDLKGKTIYSTGKNNTPEYVLNHILKNNGMDPNTDVTIEYKSEASEVATILAQQQGIGILPQPYVTAAIAQNPQLKVALDFTQEWEKVSPESSLVTGVLVVNKEFAEQNKQAFDEFLQEYKASIQYLEQNPTQGAELVAQFGIVPKAAIAEKALPQCNVVYIEKQEMKEKLSGYLQALYEQNPKSIGGSLPDSDFYYEAE